MIDYRDGYFFLKRWRLDLINVVLRDRIVITKGIGPAKSSESKEHMLCQC